MEDSDFLKAEQQKALSTPTSRLDQVIFTNIQEVYHLDQPLSFSFKVDSSLCPSVQDRIGLYSVGWRSVNDHLSYVNVKLPLNDDRSGAATLLDLPNNEEDFYQLCYIDGLSQVHGASSPFQFVADDFDIIDDIPDASLLDSIDGCVEAKLVDYGTKSAAGPGCCGTVNQKGNQEMNSGDVIKKTNHTALMCDAVESTDEGKKEATFYPMPTWFHNPYLNYIPANITTFADVRIECSEIWPKTVVIE